MKFIWNEPRLHDMGKGAVFPVTFWTLPIIGWLQYNDVWVVDNDRELCTFEYNDLYHNFDITIYENHRPFTGPPRTCIDAMIKYLKSTKLSWHTYETFRWSNKREMIKGVRFFIDAEDSAKKKKAEAKEREDKVIAAYIRAGRFPKNYRKKR